MKKILFLLFAATLLMGGKAYTQTEVRIDSARFTEWWFNNLDEAKKNPEKVWYLDLSLKKLGSFPKEILQFKREIRQSEEFIIVKN